MRTGVMILLAVLAAAVPDVGLAQRQPAIPPGLAPCMTQMRLTEVPDAPNNAVVRVKALSVPFVGEVRAYGRDTMWRATIRADASVRLPSQTLEQSVELRAPEPIEAVEFDPAGASCTMHAAMIPPFWGIDGPDVPRPIVDLADGQPADPPACAQPYAGVRVVRAVEPDTPMMAMQQGITGDVVVGLAIDATGAVIYARIAQSPSVVLNQASIEAARHSKFAPAVFRCVPVADGYDFTVSYTRRIGSYTPYRNPTRAAGSRRGSIIATVAAATAAS